MDLSKLSDEDLLALKSGDLSKVSDSGLMALKGSQPQESNAFVQGARNLAAGMVRGAGSIGATALAPFDMASDALAGKGLSLESNRQRRADMDAALANKDLPILGGAETDSFLYGAGKLGGEIAGTAGAGGLIAKPLTSVAPRLAQSVASGGFSMGSPTKSAIANALIRGTGGAVQGGVQAGMVDPSNADTGALIGAAAPGVVKLAGAAGNAVSRGLESGSKRMMQSALKPTIEQLRTGKAATAVDTLLDEGINATAGGVKKLRGKIGDINTDISALIAGSGATIDKQKIADALRGTQSQFANQVSPSSDLAAIQRVGDDFMAHPLIPGADMPVQLAQQLKQGTYKALSKKYGQMGGAETEAQKALARALKEEIASAVPDVAKLNAYESKLLSTLEVAERRALMDANKNPMGLAILANNPTSWAAFMADKSALFKSLAARMANQSAKTMQNATLPNMVQQNGLLGVPSVMATSP